MIDKSISVILPAYNESLNIRTVTAKVFDFLQNNFSDFEIVVVDDGSQDNTYDTCLAIKNELGSSFKVLKHARNKGYGSALRTGLFSSSKDLVFYTDSDNQFDIDELLGFIEYIDDYDLVIGYRRNRQDSKLRKFTSFVYNRIIRLFFGLKVKDIDCSFKLFRRDSLKKLSIEKDKFFVDTELLLKAKLNKYRLKEIGITHFPRKFGKSTIRFSNIFETLLDIFYFLPRLRI